MKDNNMFADYGKTEPIGGFDSFGSTIGGTETDYGKAEPSGDFGSKASDPTDFGSWGSDKPRAEDIPTRPANGTAKGMETDPFDATTPNGFPFGGNADLFPDIEPTDVIGPEGTNGFLPVVGWLVCIEGNDRGRDYRLHAGFNIIGRHPGNDVCIAGDNSISREEQARIAYDPEESLFFIAPGKGVNLPRLNKKVLMMPSELKANDILTIGRTKLIFIPLCSESFNWGEQSN